MWSGADASYLAAITAAARTYTWHGTLTDVDGATYSFDAGDIVQGTGQLSRRVSAENSLDIGTVYTSEFTIRLYLSVNRYKLYGGTIDLYCDVDVNGSTYNVPMGVFFISSCTQELSCISITAYDAMAQMDEVLVDTDSGSAEPYTWISYFAQLAGITVGSSQADIEALTNGTETLTFKETDDPLMEMSCRQALSYICVCLGANAFIGRDGLLYLQAYGTVAVDDIAANERLSSSISDYTTKYTAVTMTEADTGLPEYYSVSPDDGLTYDLGSNPWLQFSDPDDRTRVCTALATDLSAIEYVPYSMSMMLRPELDPMDVLTLSGNQAGANDLGGITSIVYKLGGTMTVKCSGGNPKLASATSKTSKTATAASRAASKKSIFYSSTNLNSISIADGSTEEVISFGIVSTDNSSVTFHAEITHTLATTESEAANVYTEHDCEITAIYKINGRAQTYLPVFTEYDGKQVLHLTYFFTVQQGSTVELAVELLCAGGSISIAAGDARAYVSGSTIGAVGEFSTERFIGVYDDIRNIIT